MTISNFITYCHVQKGCADQIKLENQSVKSKDIVMFNTQKDQVFTLIKSLSKSEKRNFKLYVNRFHNQGNTKSLQLFDTIDKMDVYDESIILRKNKGINKKNLPNLKRHLYKQVLTSLRLIYINKEIDIEIREQLDFARILYGKGMYMQSLKILERIKKIAVDHHQDILHLEILDFQKRIEARHITRSRQAGKIEDLLSDAVRRSWVTYAASRFSSLNIQIHGWYIEHGHTITAEQKKAAHAFYKQHIPNELDDDRMTFHEKVNLHQANMWLHYILMDLKKSQNFALNWINLFESDQVLMEKDPDLYMRGYYYLLTLFFMQKEPISMGHYYQKLDKFIASQAEIFNENSHMIAFVYQQLSLLNYQLLVRDYQAILKEEEQTMQQIDRFKGLLDPHRAMLFYYKFAYAQFALRDYDQCLLRLNRILSFSDGFLRSDVLYAVRLLQVICHIELENYDVAAHLISSCKRSFAQRPDVSPLQQKLLTLMDRLSRAHPEKHRKLYLNFSREVNLSLKTPEEFRNSLFFDLSAYLSFKLNVTEKDLSGPAFAKNVLVEE